MEEYDETTYIETLCPVDRDTLDANGVPIPDISDRELNTLLTRSPEKRGIESQLYLTVATLVASADHFLSRKRGLPPQ